MNNQVQFEIEEEEEEESIFEQYPPIALDQIDYRNFSAQEMRTVAENAEFIARIDGSDGCNISEEDIVLLLAEVFCWIMRGPSNAFWYAKYAVSLDQAMHNKMVDNYPAVRAAVAARGY